jgi:holo-[acyl-carrier protein] synthase
VILGMGLDTVYLPSFREQLADPASRFAAGTFTAGERESAAARADGDIARHLAVRFAAKEAVVKAWSAARWGRRPTMEAADLRDIEVVCDAWDRPEVRLHGAVAHAVAALAGRGAGLRWHLSLSHDGPVATAVALVERVASAPDSDGVAP